MNWIDGTVVERDRLDLGHQHVVSVKQLGPELASAWSSGSGPSACN